MSFDTYVIAIIAKERMIEAEQYAARRRLLGPVRPRPRRALRVRLGSALIWIGTLIMGPAV